MKWSPAGTIIRSDGGTKNKRAKEAILSETHLAKVQGREDLVPLPALVVRKARPVALEEPSLPVPVPPELVEVPEYQARPAPPRDVAVEVVVAAGMPGRGRRGERPLPVRQDGRSGRRAGPGAGGGRPGPVPGSEVLALGQLDPPGAGDGGERRLLRRVDRGGVRGGVRLGAEGVLERPRAEAAQALFSGRKKMSFKTFRPRDPCGFARCTKLNAVRFAVEGLSTLHVVRNYFFVRIEHEHGHAVEFNKVPKNSPRTPCPSAGRCS